MKNRINEKNQEMKEILGIISTEKTTDAVKIKKMNKEEIKKIK